MGLKIEGQRTVKLARLKFREQTAQHSTALRSRCTNHLNPSPRNTPTRTIHAHSPSAGAPVPPSNPPRGRVRDRDAQQHAQRAQQQAPGALAAEPRHHAARPWGVRVRVRVPQCDASLPQVAQLEAALVLVRDHDLFGGRARAGLGVREGSTSVQVPFAVLVRSLAGSLADMSSPCT